MTRRADRWWHGVEAEAEAEDPTGMPEPWADRPLPAAMLTADQRAVLAGLDDQPDGPRLDGMVPDEAVVVDQPSVPRLRPGNGTGNALGDARPAHPYRRIRWTGRAQEQDR